MVSFCRPSLLRTLARERIGSSSKKKNPRPLSARSAGRGGVSREDCAKVRTLSECATRFCGLLGVAACSLLRCTRRFTQLFLARREVVGVVPTVTALARSRRLACPLLGALPSRACVREPARRSERCPSGSVGG